MHGGWYPERVELRPVQDLGAPSTDAKSVAGPRRPNGSLSELDFMRPKSTRCVINAGIPVDLPFKGAARDLGAFVVN